MKESNLFGPILETRLPQSEQVEVVANTSRQDVTEATVCPNCQTQETPTPLRHLQQVNFSPQARTQPLRIKRECIEQVFAKVEVVGKSHGVCDGRTARAQAIDERSECFSPEYITYTHELMNLALSCLGQNHTPLDPNLLVPQLAQESGFRGTVYSTNGRGFGQLTGSAIDVMTNPAKPGRQWLEGVLQQASLTQPRCQFFLKLLDMPKGGQSAINSCAFLSPHEGYPRSIIVSLGLLAFYRSGTEPSLEETLSATIGGDHVHAARVSQMLAMIAYRGDRHRPAAGAVARDIGLFMRPQRGGRLQDLQQIEARIRKQSWYLGGEIPTKQNTVFGNAPVDCIDTSTTTSL